MKNKKRLKGKNENSLAKNEEEEKEETKLEEILKENDGIDREKEFLTIEDLVLLIKAFERQDKRLKNSQMSFPNY